MRKAKKQERIDEDFEEFDKVQDEFWNAGFDEMEKKRERRYKRWREF